MRIDPRPANIASLSEQSPLGLDLLQLGIIACVLAFTRGEMMGPEQHLYPKELLFHLCAFAAAGFCLAKARGIRLDAVDLGLALFLALGLLSTLNATNGGLALRALAITASGLAVFWAARALAARGFGRHLTLCVAVAVALTAATSLLEAYGVIDQISTTNRAPGGTIGNRNRMAHLLVLGLPVLVLHALGARTRLRLALAASSLAAVAAALVLSRCRAAWLAGIVAALLVLLALWTRRDALRPLGSRKRAGLLAASALAGAALALWAPNQLSWRSASPHWESLSTLVDHQSGSGRGRLIQYANTLGMVRDHPWLGVGPGNWAIQYPRYTSPGDPSYQAEALFPTNQVPQGDWIGIAAERGLPALLVLVLLGGAIAFACIRRLRRETDPQAILHAVVLLWVLAALSVIGLLDPVLLTALAAFLVFLVVGALLPREKRLASIALGPRRRAVGGALVLLVALAPVTASAKQWWAARLYGRGAHPDLLARATQINSGDYRAHMLLAQFRIRQGSCDAALPHLESARRLFPHAPAPDRLLDQCARSARGK